MADELKNPLSSPGPSQAKGKYEPKIRTMKSDVQELFKEGKETLVSAVARETKRGEQNPLTPYVPKKRGRRLLMALFVMVLAGIVGAGGYFGYLYIMQKTEPPVTLQTTIPRPYFSMEKSRNIVLPVHSFLGFGQELAIIRDDKEREGTFKRIVLLVKENEESERLGDVKEIFLASNINAQKSLIENVSLFYNYFLYYQKDSVRRGIVLQVLNEQKAFRSMIDSESFLRSAFDGLYEENAPKGSLAAFEDITYRDVDLRRLRLSSTEDLGFYYAIFKPKKYLVITTSLESMKSSLDRIFDSF